jgi:hypothetical protein
MPSLSIYMGHCSTFRRWRERWRRPSARLQPPWLAPRERTLFVSANGWDADGCKRDGRTVAFIDRGGAPPALAPDLRITSLAELASRAQQ